MTASKMMSDIDNICVKLCPVYNQVINEIEACANEWHELGESNKQTHDEAVELLLRVQDHVRALHTATRIIASQLNKVLYTKGDSSGPERNAS